MSLILAAVFCVTAAFFVVAIICGTAEHDHCTIREDRVSNAEWMSSPRRYRTYRRPKGGSS